MDLELGMPMAALHTANHTSFGHISSSVHPGNRRGGVLFIWIAGRCCQLSGQQNGVVKTVLQKDYYYFYESAQQLTLERNIPYRTTDLP
jgi:hypothetical protein